MYNDLDNIVGSLPVSRLCLCSVCVQTMPAWSLEKARGGPLPSARYARRRSVRSRRPWRCGSAIAPAAGPDHHIHVVIISIGNIVVEVGVAVPTNEELEIAMQVKSLI